MDTYNFKDIQNLQNNKLLQSYCYLSNNNFAYKWDIKDNLPSRTSTTRSLATPVEWKSDMKTGNFVPTYDTWCLYCNNHYAKSRCSRCHAVYFCDRQCQQKAWPIHKKHCGRDLFLICITCGSSDSVDTFLKCSECPVKFCSQICKSKLFKAHKDFDCTYFQKVFK